MNLFVLIALVAAEVALVCTTFTKWKEKPEWRKNRALVRLIETALVFGIVLLPTTGEYSVNEVSGILVDSSRKNPFESDGSDREVPVHFYYPETDSAESNSFPLILFSHGAFGYYQSNYSTYMELASHGYVVVALDHPHHSFFTKDTAGKTVLFQNAGHMDFTDLPLISPTLANMLGHGDVNSEEFLTMINGIILDWFDYTLKGEGTPDIQAKY